MNTLVAVVGPTGIGKSRLAIRLAQDFGGEIVSADSRQVYRLMDIGTAKPSWQERSLVSHHLIDIIYPDEDFSLARYQQLADQAISGIQKQSRLALLVGGSGLYIWSVLEGWGIPGVPPDLQLRRELQEEVARNGVDRLYNELIRIDPVAAEKIDPRNVRRVIRALEVYRGTKIPFSQLQKRGPIRGALIIGLTADRAELYRRVDLRIEQMLEQGLVEEVKKLVEMGYGIHLPSMSGIGYKQMGLFLKGELTLETAVKKIKTETHRFVRRQYNWFRLNDNRIRWFDIQQEKIEGEIREQVAGLGRE
ncbi:MAG: tRNA (adenosine(37)-N6)-dimethylallyltransferase MiaA [Dehalococcoidales bacterium]|nr:MAG: tRNA (adenosine(37)-N6)-dimethylallyltransferase MiaA [Dehalococcoidales bacterium]